MKTPDFALRPWFETDLDNVVKYANNPNISNNHTNMFPYPYARADAEKFYAHVSKAEPANILAIVNNNEFIGSIGLHFQGDIFFRNAEMGYWIAEPFWGRGIATAAIQQMVDYGFRTFEITRIFARPFGSNIGSQRALEKAGFVLEARLAGTICKNGRIEDELIYAVRK
ncbi:MAG: GNAT family N-acetyltransferase [Bacteroidota bacterium]|jgi:ribosomal-protein-alanine N-acetyltransferase